MIRKVINIGILAHVDAGKTSLTERLLFHHNAVEKLGSVDDGSTTTDSGDLERERGITIRSAVASFTVGSTQVNLIDTPGHPDFIAEVERALSVLDGVVLVVSAVEGVQAQTIILMRSLKKIVMPTIIFANKIDRMGARTQPLIDEIERRLDVSVVQLNKAIRAGHPDAHTETSSLVERKFDRSTQEKVILSDERLFDANLPDQRIPFEELFKTLTQKVAQTELVPLFFGSAVTGVGIEDLSVGIETLFPDTADDASELADCRGTVFAIERNVSGEKIALLRLFSGRLESRQSVKYSQLEADGTIREYTERITSLDVVGQSEKMSQAVELIRTAQVLDRVMPGNIAKIRGWRSVRVGAQLGGVNLYSTSFKFQAPSLEAVIKSQSNRKNSELYDAMLAMSDEDPLIQAKVIEGVGLHVKLYGEVQKEVIQERLKRERNIDAVFSETTPVFLERPVGIGEAEHEYDKIDVRGNLFPITVGIRVEPNDFGEGNQFTREAKWGLMPDGFYRIIEDSALSTLEQGLTGWEVLDCRVVLTKVAYERPLTNAAHFRYLTRFLVLQALRRAKTKLYEPYQTYELEVPLALQGALITRLILAGASIDDTKQTSNSTVLLKGAIPARNLQKLVLDLPALTNGQGILVSYQGVYREAFGEIKNRPRADGNPLNYEEYVKYLLKNKLL